MVDKGEFFLKGYNLNQPVNLSYSGQTITIETDTSAVVYSEKLKKEGNKVETAKLTIAGTNEKETLRQLAIDIKNILSIGLGKRVIFDRQVYSSNEQSEQVEKEMSKNENQGEQIIPDFEIRKYLEQVLPAWNALSKREKDDIFTITDYLNQTRHDFIEDRILRTIQAWECAANYWIKDVELSNELKDLREKIKETYKQWKTEAGYKDEDGELGKRLTSVIDQEKLLIRLNKLVNENQLKPDKIELDLKKLKDLRDLVAHTGRINIPGTEAVYLLQRGITGLQLILLRRLGYTGQVIAVKGYHESIIPMSESFV